MTSETTLLEWLLSPAGTGTFLERYWEREPLVIHRQAPAYYGSLVTLEEFDRALTTPGLRHPDLLVANANADLSDDDFMIGGTELDLVEIARLFSEGATVAVNAMHRRSESLATFCRTLEAEMSCRVQANVYLSPPRAQGFRRHYDMHSVFVLQVLGSKRWRLFGSPVELPLPRQVAVPGDDEARPSMVVELKQGDMLYVPRGVEHEPATGEDMSMHVTVGMRTFHWSDLMAEALAGVVLQDAGFRRSLPIGYANMSFDRTEARRTFRELLDRFVARADADAALDAFVERFVTTRLALPRGPMSLLASLENLSAETVVGRRGGLVFDLREENAHIRLRCHGREIQFPRHAGACLRFALERASFAIRELPDALDEAGKMVLAKRLVREGVLQVMDRRPAV